jgi:hypothetical protein
MKGEEYVCDNSPEKKENKKAFFEMLQQPIASLGLCTFFPFRIISLERRPAHIRHKKAEKNDPNSRWNQIFTIKFAFLIFTI